MTDFSLNELNFALDITSVANIAEIDGQIKNFIFTDQQINKQGNVYLDIRQIMRDNSEAIQDTGDDIEGYLGKRHKQLNPLVFF